MCIFRAEARFVLLVIATLMTVLITWGCTTMNHSYDLGTSFGGLKNYKWGSSSALARQYSLVESNVQFIADQILEKKGFKKSSVKPDFMISIDYDYEIGGYIHQYGTPLRMLTMNIYRVDNKELIWQGTKLGAIKSDATSGDLNKAVEDILSKFPPK